MSIDFRWRERGDDPGPLKGVHSRLTFHGGASSCRLADLRCLSRRAGGNTGAGVSRPWLVKTVGGVYLPKMRVENLKRDVGSGHG